jgi:hypothetical protein
MTATRSLVISTNAYPSDQAEALKAVEAFARVAAGLAIEGITVSINATTVEDEED